MEDDCPVERPRSTTRAAPPDHRRTAAEADRAARLLAGAGITTIYRLEGNFTAWQDAAYAIEVGAFAFIEMSLATAHERMTGDTGLVVLDVSAHAYHSTVHIPGSECYSVPDGTFDAGFLHVYILDGNLSDWVVAGYEFAAGAT